MYDRGGPLEDPERQLKPSGKRTSRLVMMGFVFFFIAGAMRLLFSIIFPE
jgi:hypothetical protein